MISQAVQPGNPFPSTLERAPSGYDSWEGSISNPERTFFLKTFGHCKERAEVFVTEHFMREERVKYFYETVDFFLFRRFFINPSRRRVRRRRLRPGLPLPGCELA